MSLEEDRCMTCCTRPDTFLIQRKAQAYNLYTLAICRFRALGRVTCRLLQAHSSKQVLA